MGAGGQEVYISSYKVSKSRDSNVQPADYG